jgi:hypothetical protein
MTYYLDQTVTCYLATSQFSTGAAFDATGNPAYRVYEQNTNTPILTGSFALLDDASTVGLYSVNIAATAANGFEVGKTYCVYGTATVDGVAAGAALMTFNIQNTPSTPADVPTASTIATTVWNTLVSSYNVTGSIGAASVTNMGKAINMIVKLFRNRTTKSGAVQTVYDDNNTTVLTTTTYVGGTSGTADKGQYS